MPASAICLFSLRQYPHHVVEYIVTTFPVSALSAFNGSLSCRSR
jgi:hypothetical protein